MMSIEIYGKEQKDTPMPGGNDWIFPGSDIRPPIEDDWALYLDPMKDDMATLQAGAAAIMQEWAGITSVDGRIFSGREQKALDPREYYQKAIRAFREGSLDSLWSDEYREFHEAKARGDKAAMRAMAAKKIKGEGVGHAVREAYDKYSQSYLTDVDRGLNSIRDALSPEELAILDAPRAVDPEYEALLEEYSTPSMYDSPAYGLQDPQRAAVAARQAQLDRERFDRHDELYRKHHSEIEGERRLASYERQLEDENLWAVIESLKGHISDGAQRVVDLALQRGNEPTSTAVMNEFEKLSTPEQRSIAGILQALHYSRGDGGWTLARDAGNAFMDTLESVTVGAVRGAADLVRRTWMDGDEYRDMVERRVLLEDANRERMNDWGYLGNTVIGVASTIPYMAAAAIPYVGMADMIFAARDQFQSEAMRNGVDVSSLDFIIGSSAFAIAYAYVEKIQWERMGLGSLGKLTNLSRRQMYCDMFHSVRAALGVAGAVAGSMLTESGEEGIQRAMEVVVEKWGGATLADAVAGFTEDFVQSLGTMAILGAVGAGRQHIAFRHGALGYDKADAVAAQGRSVELERLVLGHPGEVGPLSSYGRTYGRMVEHWLNAGTDADDRQAALQSWGLDAEQAQAIHGALQRVWTAIEGSAASSERKEEMRSALVGGGHVLTPGEVIAQIQSGSYHGKVETLDDGSQAVDLTIGGKTLRMVVDSASTASEIDPDNAAMFESIVNALNERNVLDADGAKFTVEGWSSLTSEQRKSIIDANELRNQGDVRMFDADGKPVASMDGRVLDAITGKVQLTDAALPQTAFHETMHGVLNLLTNMATGEKSADGGWKVAPDKDAAALIDELAKLHPAQSAREAVNEEALADAFQAYLTGKIDVVEHPGLLDRLGRFLANLFGYGGKTHEFATPRTAQQRLFNTAITGHVAQALQAAEAQPSGQERDQAGTPGDQAPAQGDQVGEQGDQVGAETASSETESVLQGIEERHPDLAETVAMFRNRDPITREQMQQLRDAAGSALDDAAVMNAGYRWNEAQDRWDHFDKLDGTLDERDMRHGVAPTRLVPGADLSDAETARELVNYFKTYDGEEPPKRLLDASPEATYAWFRENLVGKTFQIGDRTFTVKEGHYFRFVCETPKDENERKGWIGRAGSAEEARRLVEAGEVSPTEIAGYVPARAASLPLSAQILSKPDAILLKGHKIHLLKKFKTGNTKSDVAIFLLNQDGKTLGLETIHMRRIGMRFLNGCTLVTFGNEGAFNDSDFLAPESLPTTDDARDTSAGTPPSQTPNAPEVNSENQERHQVSPRLPSPEFAMDGTIADALPAHLREDARAIIAERANTPAWMVEPDGTPTDLNERDWLRREAEARHEAGRRFAVSGAAPTAEERAEAQRQYDAVVARFTNLDGTKKPGWMKAPNGQPTRLTERQWVQVRTENFKRWFGDWEAAAMWQAIERLPQIAVTKRGDSLSVEDAYEALGEGINGMDGRRIRFVNSALGKILRHKGYPTERIVHQLKDIFEQSVPIGFRPVEDRPGHKQHRNFIGYHDYVGKIQDGEQTFYVRITVQELKTRSKKITPNEFHSSYISDVELYKGTDALALDTENSTGKVGALGSLDGLLADIAGKGKNSSRVVDENGEPLVVYHDTNSTRWINRETGEDWDTLPMERRAEWEERDDWDEHWKEEDFWRFDNRNSRTSVEFPAHFFAPEPDPYHEYGKRRIASFLNLRNPVENPDIPHRGETYTAGLDEMERLKRQGVDGFIRRYDGKINEFGVFAPAAIKSATDNIGTFDGGNADIRYQIAGRAGAERLGIRGLGDAEAMERSGATREEIWRETGWWRGADGEWRVEIPDFTLSMETLDREAYQNDPEFFVRKRKLPDLITDTALFNAYPQLRRVTVQTPHSDTFGGLNTFGDYNGGTRIRLNMSALKFAPEDVRATLAHEIQHAIQKMEGFAQGGNAGMFKPVDAAKLRRKAKAERRRGNEAEAVRLEAEADELEENALDGMVVVDQTGYMDEFEAYHSLAGEVEARNVEKRLKMTPEERAATPPWATEDVEEGRQIVRYSIQAFADGTRFVHVDTDQALFDNAKEKDYPKIARRIILHRFRGKVVGGEKPQNAYVKTETAGEFAYPAKPLPREENSAKMRSAGELGNLLAVGEFAGHKADDGTHPEAIGGWDYYNTIFEVGGKFFEGKVNILTNKRGRVFHDVTDVKENSQGLKDQHGEPRALFPASVAKSESHSGGDVNGESGGRGSVAGSDPGWFDLAGQLGAAEREARETARHGLAFGGARFSNRSWVEAFAARDKVLKIERSDEDYERLIAALGLAGKMTAADARESAEALQREVKGGAGVIADLVKAAEKKNFRQTVEKIVSAAHGYGMEVGANARQAWERYLSEMRRTAKGRDAADFTNDTGWDLAELLWAANEAGFELQRKGKPAAAEGAPQEAGGATDDETELEAALIDGREGDLGLTAEEAREKLHQMLEERMGDVEGRRSRLRAALEAWRKSEAARIEKLRAEREAKEAAKATAEADATAGMDDRADAEGKHTGERPEEENEDEAVEEMPDFKAFCERLKAEGLDLENPGEVAYVMRWYVEDWMAKKSGKAPGEVLKDPVAAAQYRRTVVQLLRDAANKLLDPNDGMAAKTVERMIGEIPGDATANEIQSRSRSIIGFIKRNAIRQSRKQLVKGIQDDIQKQGIKGKKFDETEKDIGRKITGEREAYCRYLKRILNWGSRRIAAEQQRLNDIITGRLDAYKAARGEDAALEALQTTDREIHRATERLNALQLWGGLRSKSPGEIARAGQQIHEWLEKERDEHEKRWAEWMAHNDEMAARIVQAVSAGMGDYTPDDPGAVGQLVDLLTTNFRSRLERLAAGSGADGRRAIDEVMMLIYAGSERLGVLKTQRRQRTDAMLARCVEGSGQTVGEFLKSLDENISEELNRRLITEEQPTRMTWGQALQLLGSLEQTASYKRNIDENGRGAVGLDGAEQTPHRDLILQALADKPQMLRLVEEMRKIYDEDREAISREFFAVTGNAVLTPDPLYLPARMFTGARENLETTVRAWNPFGPAFTPRIANKRDFDLSASIMDVYNERMKETATALAFGMRGMELRSVLARKSVQEAIARTHGKFALRKMIAHLTDIVSDGYKGDGGQLEGYRKAIRAVGDLTTYSALSWNVVTMLKQMTSIPAWTALLDGGYGEIFRHIVHFDAAAAKELMASPGFTARYGAESFARMFRQELENPQGGNVLARFYKAGMTAVQMGDFVPGILVGTGVYKARKLALMRKGLSEGAAREQSARETWGLIEENQQSSRLENTPEILRRGGFIGRQLSKFATSPMMQVGHAIHTLRMWLAEARLEARHGGKESGAVKAMLNARGDDAARWRKRFVNQFVCNHVLMPAAMYAIATVFNAALGGDPPDKEEVYGDLVMQMVVGPWSRIFLLGAVADTTGEWAARLLGGKPNVYSRGDLAATQHLHKAMSNAGRLLYDTMDMDWGSCRDDFVKMLSSYNAPFRYTTTIVQNATGYDPAQARRARKREIAKREAAGD